MTSKVTRLCVVLGSGGVGKTTTSSALALAYARRGYRVALITIDPAMRLAQSLGLDQLGAQLSPVPLHPHLWAMMLDRVETARRLVETFASTPQEAQNIIDNKYFQSFSATLAGAHEYLAVHAIYEILRDQRYDFIVLDTPPARHAFEFLELPQRLRDALENSALKWITREGVGPDEDSARSRGIRSKLSKIGKGVMMRAFSQVTAGVFVDDLLQFLRLFGRILHGLKESGVALEALSKSELTSYWVVTTSHDGSIEVARQIERELIGLNRTLNHLLINRMPTCFSTEETRVVDAIFNEINSDRLEDESSMIEGALLDLSPRVGARLSTLWRSHQRQVAQAQEVVRMLSSICPNTLCLPTAPSGSSPVECVHQLSERLYDYLEGLEHP
jgi:anion-transporting  ArsA/GET3 family ATPase